MMIAAKKTRWFRSSYRNTCIRSMEKENDEYLKTIKLKVTKCKRTQNYKSSFTVVFFSTIQLHHKFITSHTTTKNEIQTRFSKWCENEKRKLKFISVFQRDAKTKYEVQNRFSKLVENEKQKAKFKSVFQCHAKTKNGNGTWIPFSHAIEKRLAPRYTH